MESQSADEPLLPSNPAARTRVIPAILFVAVAAFVAYIGMYRPVREALATGGPLHYYVKGVLLPPVLVYLAILMLIVDVRDGQIMRTNSAGKKSLTRKGWWVLVGAAAVAGLTQLAWTAYLGAMGFHASS